MHKSSIPPDRFYSVETVFNFDLLPCFNSQKPAKLCYGKLHSDVQQPDDAIENKEREKNKKWLRLNFC